MERYGPWAASVALFVIAFLPRALSIGSYVTVDEQRWIERSVDFVYNLNHGDLATIASVHPGVTATWGFGLFLLFWFLLRGDVSPLYQMRADGDYDLLTLLPVAGMFTVVVTAITVVLAYWLLRKLFRERVAFLAALLIALDPNYLAHSRRVHVDAILASTMLLSVLALLVYVVQPRVTSLRRYLVLSAIFAGLAWLTKLPALYLIPFTVLALAGRLVFSTWGQQFKASLWWRETKSFLLWTVVAILVFILLWPSMWTQPGEVLAQLAHTFTWGLESTHTSALAADAAPMQFFLGKVVVDPGPGYYPLISAFRLSPVVSAFFLVGLSGIVLAQWRKRWSGEERLAAWLGVAYIFFFVAMISLGAKKLESYVLPVFPMVDIIAALGLCAFLDWLAKRWHSLQGAPEQSAAWILYSVTVIAIIASSFLWLRLRPYYSAYFNPLLGGTRIASRLFVFGGGEGLDLAAQYLNQKEGAEGFTVSSAYPNHVFRHHFKGTTWPLTQDNWNGLWLLSDYVVAYFSYAQRDIPSPEVVEALERFEPEFVVPINGLEYARVYKVPPLILDAAPAITHPAEVNLGDKVTFLGYDIETVRAEAGDEIAVTLYWQRKEPLEADYSAYLRLINGVYDVWGGQDGGPLWSAMPTSLWEEGMVVVDERRIPILPGTPPGAYQIELGMYDPMTMVHLEPVDTGGNLLLGPVEVVRGTGSLPPTPQVAQEANFGNRVRLIGYDLEREGLPGGPLRLTLFWESLAPMDEDYTVFVHLSSEDDQIWGQRDSQPVTGFYPTSLWTPGEFVRDQVSLPISDEAPAGKYSLKVGMYHPDTGQRLPVLSKTGKITGDSIILSQVDLNGP
jgi:4-amino-4-deoxy-L-arabinose transferase-like glycosyltransferase